MPKGKVETTDQQIIDDWNAGKFIGWIRKRRHVGKNRIYAVLDRKGLRKGEEAIA